MAAREVPEPWRPLFKAAGIGFTARRLADKADMDLGRVLRVLHNEPVRRDAIHGVADAFGVKPDRVAEIRGEILPEPFTLPDGADRLSPTQRDAVRAVVRAMLEPGDEVATVTPIRRAARKPDTPKAGDEQ